METTVTGKVRCAVVAALAVDTGKEADRRCARFQVGVSSQWLFGCKMPLWKFLSKKVNSVRNQIESSQSRTIQSCL